ncbi:APOPT family protein CBG23705, mitochondrial [Exaiptasia diaphana]|uniref:Uncharacterized protein n=1 Tax=Exaiptasia diaphana TaxID=2652724 RepID=A0A913XT83_EXADI|nr:APOPT family protein CBG23705, mitochondrial [Exaiptasia diaphana]KXJ24694.1 Apoptogenic protein 1, mitochondrial [Exaiptasia diaphana]
MSTMRSLSNLQKSYQVFQRPLGVLRCGGVDRSLSSQVDDSKEHDLIGPPHSVSNLRKVVFSKKTNETRKEQELRLHKQASYKWQHTFWAEHNDNFNKSKKKFLEERKNTENESDKQFADDLSIFYKDFLDKNYSLHKKFLWEWYKKNFKLLWPSFTVLVERLTKSVQGRNR